MKSILIFCKSCKKKHRMTMQPCPNCDGRGGSISQPVSDNVFDNCYANYECEGCESYRDHTGV